MSSTTVSLAANGFTSSAEDSDTAMSQEPSACDDAQCHVPVAMPDGGVRAWLTVVGSTCALTATFGIINSIGTFQTYLNTHQLRSFQSRDVGWIPGVNILLCFILGVQSGPLFDRYGPRWLLIGGSILYIAGLVGMSFTHCSEPRDMCNAGSESATVYALLMVTWGLLCGLATAVITTTSLAVVAHWFDAKRGLAVGIAYAGSSIGGVVFPLLMRETLDRLGWNWSVRIVLLIALVLLLLANVLIRGRTKELNAGKKHGKIKVIDFGCFADARFVWATLGIGMFEFVVAAALGVLPTWAKARGFDDSTAFAILAVYNAGSFFGRIVAGAVSDYFGRLNATISTLVLAIAIVCGLWIPVNKDRLGLFYVFACTFGFSTGSIMSLAPVCIGQFCKPSDFGRYLGTSYSLVGIFCFMSIPVGAEVVDKLGPELFCVLFAVFLSIALFTFTMARLTALEYKWKWRIVM
ncbi:hypothetical protein CDD82_2500 [Ophiocordyceps australis]|uniref:Major facilitator superfamily (MFS) profile domain-containing protein n=1 Tax=Ophiocordyceps australis TaxID=1399860 RepID=A0A2C5ZGZ9_9HYPO|nr:hypothetical protein CDD82_2500 [Ophiocordyceps australis]